MRWSIGEVGPDFGVEGDDLNPLEELRRAVWDANPTYVTARRQMSSARMAAEGDRENFGKDEDPEQHLRCFIPGHGTFTAEPGRFDAGWHTFGHLDYESLKGKVTDLTGELLSYYENVPTKTELMMILCDHYRRHP